MALNLSPFRSGEVIRDPSMQSPQWGEQAGQAFLQAFLNSQRESGANSRSSAERDVQLQELKFRSDQEKTKQAQLKAQGEAMKILLPHLIATGQATNLTDQGGSGVGGANTPVPQSGGLPAISQTPNGAPTQPMSPADIYASVIQNADPSIIKGLDESVGATVASAQKAYNAKQSGKALQTVLKTPDAGAALAELPPEVMMSVLDDVAKVQTIKTQARRDMIAAKYPASPNETPQQMIARLGKMSGEFATAGDHAMVASLASDIGALTPSKTDYEWFQKKDGSTVYLPKEEGSRLGLGKPMSASGFGFGAAGPLGAMRALSGIKGMEDADDKMRRFEIDIASGKADYNRWDYVQGHLSQLYNQAAKESGIVGKVVPFFDTIVGSEMMELLNRENPKLANYLQAASQWALEESLLSNRPSDYRTKMDEAISAIKPQTKNRPNVQGIHDLWRSRSVRLQGYKAGEKAIIRRFQQMENMPGATVIPDTP